MSKSRGKPSKGMIHRYILFIVAAVFDITSANGPQVHLPDFAGLAQINHYPFALRGVIGRHATPTHAGKAMNQGTVAIG